MKNNVQNLYDAIDSARIAKQLDDVQREIAFAVDTIEWLAMCRARFTSEERNTIRCMIRSRSYNAAMKHIELNQR